MQKLKISCFIIGVFLLFGCKKDFKKEYLLEHPKLLQKELERCQGEMANNAYCKEIGQTVDYFNQLVISQSDNPQGFGQQILLAQIKLVDLKKKLNEVKKSSNPGMELNVNEIQRAYQNQAHFVKTLLAVIGNSPVSD